MSSRSKSTSSCFLSGSMCLQNVHYPTKKISTNFWSDLFMSIPVYHIVAICVGCFCVRRFGHRDAARAATRTFHFMLPTFLTDWWHYCTLWWFDCNAWNVVPVLSYLLMLVSKSRLGCFEEGLMRYYQYLYYRTGFEQSHRSQATTSLHLQNKTSIPDGFQMFSLVCLPLRQRCSLCFWKGTESVISALVKTTKKEQQGDQQPHGIC